MLSLFLLVSSPAKAQINVPYTINMGKIAYNIDDYTSAIRFFNQAIEARPNLSEPYYLRGVAKFALEDMSGAKDDCTQAIERNPFQSAYYQLRALCYLNLHQYPQAAADYLKVLKTSPDDPRIRFNYAYALMQNHKDSLALQQTRYILGRDKTYERAYLLQTDLYLQAKDTTAALACVDTLLTFKPYVPEAWYIKGLYAYNHQQYAAADTCLTQALRTRPNNADYYFLRALSHNALHQFDPALADYNKVISLVPQHFSAHYNRALLLSTLGDDQRAIADYSFVLKRDPENAMAHYNRAIMYKQTGDYKHAIDDLTFLLQRYPNFINGYLLRAFCYKKLGKTSLANDDEAQVERFELDIRFAQHTPKTINKVHVTDLAKMAKEEQPKEDDIKHFRIFGDAAFGQLQYRKVDQRLLPLFTINVLRRGGKNYRPNIYMAALQTLEKQAQPLFDAIDRDKSFWQRSQMGKLHFKIELINQKQQHLQLPTAAWDSLTQSLPLSPLTQQLLTGIYALQKYAYTEALQHFNHIIEQDPKNVIAHWLRANIYYLQATASKSKPSATPAKSSPTPATSSPADFSKEHLRHSLQDTQQALRLLPEQPYLLYNQALIRAQMQQPQKAILLLSQAIEQNPIFAEAYFNRALLYLQLDQEETAQTDLQRAGELGIDAAYALLKNINEQNQKP